MDGKKIRKLRRELQQLRAGKYNLKPSDLVSLAKKLGRWRDTSRGKEPTYVSNVPGARPLSIPGHPTINPYTADSVLDVLEADLDRFEDLLEAEEKEAEEKEAEEKKADENKGLPRTTVRKNRDSN